MFQWLFTRGLKEQKIFKPLPPKIFAVTCFRWSPREPPAIGLWLEKGVSFNGWPLMESVATSCNYHKNWLHTH